jgi:uncharacterized protein (TIRG00374 family)
LLSPWRVLSFLLGLALLAALLRAVGWKELLQLAREVRWTFVALVVLFGGVHFLRTLSWRICLGPQGKSLSLWHLLRIWVQGEAVSYLGFGWTGEAFRAAATREVVPLARGLSALVISRAVYTYAGLLVLAASGVVTLAVLPIPGPLRLPVGVVTAVLVGLALWPWLRRSRFRQVLEPGPAAESEPARGLRGRARALLRTLRSDLAAIFSLELGKVAWLVGVNLLAALAGVLEVYLILHAFDTEVTFTMALVIEGANKALALGAFAVPGNVGVREAGTALVCRLFEVRAALAVTLVLVRRARALAWVALGGILLLVDGFRPALSPRAGVPTSTRTG